jgi:hypothetical protein
LCEGKGTGRSAAASRRDDELRANARMGMIWGVMEELYDIRKVGVLGSHLRALLPVGSLIVVCRLEFGFRCEHEKRNVTMPYQTYSRHCKTIDVYVSEVGSSIGS